MDDESGSLLQVTSVLFPSPHSVLSASDNAASGVRQWDLRFIRQRHPQPVTIFHVPANAKRRGFTSLSVDRTGSRLFAVSTGGVVYEFSLGGHRTTGPVRELHGIQLSQCYFMDTAASPDSDHLLGGSCDGRPCVWDIGPRRDETPILYPICRLPHGDEQVTSVAWAERGVLVTCSGSDMRLWSRPGSAPLPQGDTLVEAKAELFTAPPLPLPSLPAVRPPPCTPPAKRGARRSLTLSYQSLAPDAGYAERKRLRRSSPQRGGQRRLSATPEKENCPPPSEGDRDQRRSSPTTVQYGRTIQTPTADLPNLVLQPLQHPHGTPQPSSARKTRSVGLIVEKDKHPSSLQVIGGVREGVAGVLVPREGRGADDDGAGHRRRPRHPQPRQGRQSSVSTIFFSGSSLS